MTPSWAPPIHVLDAIAIAFARDCATVTRPMSPRRVIRRHGRWRHLEAVEFATLAWGDWFNNRRLLAPLRHVPPAGVRARLLRTPDHSRDGGGTQLTEPPENPGRFTSVATRCAG